MTTRRLAILAVMIVCLGAVAVAQDEELPLANWSAPPYWNPAVQQRMEGEPLGRMMAHAQGMHAQAEALPSSPLPFVAIAPCRIVDTREPISDGFHQPNFTDDEARTFNLPASPDCTGLPATAGAWSLNIQFRPISQPAYLTAYSTGTTRPGVSTLTAGPGAWVQNAAVIPAGTGGAIDIYCQYAGRVVIDINGYYGPQGVVTSLNTLTGDVTLAEGSNVTITPSGQTLTVAATGGPGGELPAGSANQTLYHNGSAWTASSVLTNDGTNVGVSGNLALPATASILSGVLTMGGVSFLHEYPPLSQNAFLGYAAGGGFAATGLNNTGIGTFALHDLTTGLANTALGAFSMAANTEGVNNTAVGAMAQRYATTANGNTALGYHSLFADTTGSGNTAAGYLSMEWNGTGQFNVAMGYQALQANTIAMYNTAVGASSLMSNQTGNYNTAVGNSSLILNSSGAGNTALGEQAVSGNVVGDYNVGVGYYALKNVATGHYNTGLGTNAGNYLTTGGHNTFVGWNARPDSTAAGLEYGTAIGAEAVVAQDYSLVLGGTGLAAVNVGINTTSPDTRLQVVGDIKVGTTGTNGCVKNFAGTGIAGTCSSDIRLKDRVQPFGPVLDRVARLQPMHFTWRTAEFPAYHFGAGLQSGLIAQDVEQVFPEMVATDDHGYKTVNYSELPYLTLAAVRELKAENDALKAWNAQLQDQLQRLAAAVAELQARTQ